jgi:hypothetical protein
MEQQEQKREEQKFQIKQKYSATIPAMQTP